MNAAEALRGAGYALASSFFVNTLGMKFVPVPIDGGERLYRVDPQAVRNAIPDDYVAQLQQHYAGTPYAGPSNTQYGWVRAPDSLD